MSMFGWGVGDIIAISRLAVKVYTAYRDAPDDYKHISDEVKSLQILIDKAAPYFNSTSLNNNSRQEGQQALKGCQDVLQGLNSIIEKYSSSGPSRTSQVLKRIRLGTEDIASLRVRLISNTALLNAFIQSCESREIREMQEQLLGLHRTTSRSSIISFSSLAGSINTKMAYKSFCKKLFQMGVTSEMIAQNEGDILNMLNRPQDTATSDGGNGTGNSTQLPTPNLHQPRFRLSIDFLVGPRMLAAAAAGDTKRLITTLEFVRNIDFTDHYKETALHKAIAGGHRDILEIVELLLQKGASIEAKDSDDRTPLHLAIRARNTMLAVLLLHKGASTEATDRYDNTPLHAAIAHENTTLAELLLEESASIEATNNRNNTPLDLAAQYRNFNIAAILLKKGASIKAMDADKKNTLLYLAAENGHTGTVELLLEEGASIEAKGWHNNTPLHLATMNGHTTTVELPLPP